MCKPDSEFALIKTMHTQITLTKKKKRKKKELLGSILQNFFNIDVGGEHDAAKTGAAHCYRMTD